MTADSYDTRLNFVECINIFPYYNDDHCYSVMNMQPRTNADSSLTKDVAATTKVDIGGPKQQFHTSSLANGGGALIVVGSGPQDSSIHSKSSLQDLRKSLTLDFTTTTENSNKKTLQTPELISVLRGVFPSAEIEKLGLTNQSQSSAVVTTPTPTTYFFPKFVTAEQESYARGFEDALKALNHLDHQENECEPANSMLSPDFVTNAFQLYYKEGGNKCQESVVAVEQNFRALQSSAVNSVETESSIVPTPKPTLLTNKISVLPTTVPSSICNPAATTIVKQEQELSDYSSRCNSNTSSCSASSTTASSVDSYLYQSPPLSQVSQTKNRSMNYTQLAPVNFGNVVPGNLLPTAQYVTLPNGNNANASQLLGNLTNHQQIKMEQDMHNNMPNIQHHHQNGHQSHFAGPAGISPMDPVSQEKLKLDRKRMRNRIAATKCRKRKIERIETLQDEVKKVKDRNEEIERNIMMCKQTINFLKQAIKEHENKGCVVLQVNNNNVNGKRQII